MKGLTDYMKLSIKRNLNDKGKKESVTQYFQRDEVVEYIRELKAQKLTNPEICQLLDGVSLSSFEKQLNKNTKLRAAYDIGKSLLAAQTNMLFYDRLFNGQVKKTKRWKFDMAGNKIPAFEEETHQGPSDAAIIHALRNLSPEMWNQDKVFQGEATEDAQMKAIYAMIGAVQSGDVLKSNTIEENNNNEELDIEPDIDGDEDDIDV